MSSATSPLPREMSSSASSLLPIAEAPVMSTPISSTSRNTPCSVVDSASTRARYRRNDVDHVRRRLRRREERDVVRVALVEQVLRHFLAVGDEDRDQLAS